MQKFQNSFISLILSYNVSKNKSFLHFTANQAGIGHKLHCQPKHPARAKLAAINNKKWLWHGWGVIQTVRKCFISKIQSYKVIKNTAFLRCTTNQAGIGHKLHFRPNNPARAKLEPINNKNGCGTAEVSCKNFRRVSYHWYYHIMSVKINLCYILPPTKPA